MGKYKLIAYTLLYQKWWIIQPPLSLAVLAKLESCSSTQADQLLGASLSLGKCNYPTGKQLKPHARIDGANTFHALVIG